MQQTPAHSSHNPDLLAMLPKDARYVVEVGCSSGALAREYKKINSSCNYTGIEIDPGYAKQAESYCDHVFALDVETADDLFFQTKLEVDCWIFGDTLEHLKDPWAVLKKIRKVVPQHGCIVACIPNAQHWSIQARLNAGDFRYEDSGLLDRTHLRWFTKKTIIELFNSAEFNITEGIPRIFNEPDRERVMNAIRTMATSIGVNPDTAVMDALPLQYVVKAVPR